MAIRTDSGALDPVHSYDSFETSVGDASRDTMRDRPDRGRRKLAFDNAPSTTANTGVSYEFVPSISKAVGRVSFRVVGLPAWLKHDPNTGALSGVPQARDVDVTTGIVLIAADERGAVSMTFGIAVSPSNPIDATVATIRQEATRSNDHPGGRPLPLASSWDTGIYDYYWHDRPGTYLTPTEQLRLLREGHHFLPTLAFSVDESTNAYKHSFYPGYYSAWDQIAEWRLPVALISTQWEGQLTTGAVRDLEFEENPNTFDLEDPPGVILSGHSNPDLRRGRLDPLGPTKPWYDAGKAWIDDFPRWKELQERYPDPSLIILMSNNESARLRWHEAETSKRYVDAHPEAQSGDFKREVFAKNWQARYESLFQGLKDGLMSTGASTSTCTAWRDRTLFVGYAVNGMRHLARWGGWKNYSDYYPNQIVSQHRYWDGASQPYYLNPSKAKISEADFWVMSPQVEFMNQVFINNQVYAENSDFWYELSIWDGFEACSINDENPDADPPNLFCINNPLGGREGNKRLWLESLGQKYSPERYKAWIQFGMWLMKPRVVREFRGWTDSQEKVGEGYLKALLAAVDDVHASPLLSRFWRQSELLPNRTRKHPYQSDFPPEYEHEDRWFLLNTSRDPANISPDWPPGNDALLIELPVFAIASVIGEKPSREWLIYAFAPKGSETDVEVEVPGYRTVSMDVAAGGTFLYLTESTPCDAIAALITSVESLISHTGTVRSLTAKLGAAGKSMKDDRTEQALSQLEAFIHAVEAQRGKKVGTDASNELISAAETVRTMIKSGATCGP